MCNVSLHSADTAPSNLDLNGWYDVDNIIQRKKEWYKKSGIVIENIDLVEQIVGDYRRCGDNTLTGLKLTLEPLFNGNKRLLIDFIGGMSYLLSVFGIALMTSISINYRTSLF